MVNNFENSDYKNLVVDKINRSECPIEIVNFIATNILCDGKTLLERSILLKHLPPTLLFSENSIIIYKEKNDWLKSIKKDGKSPHKWTNYDYYMKQAWTLPSENSIVVEHKWACDNYYELLEMMVEKFGLKLVECPRQPMQRIDRGGADCIETKSKFDRNT